MKAANHPDAVRESALPDFNKDLFKKELSLWEGGCVYPLKFYYRDTDAPINVSKLYKKGHVVRNDRILQVTDKLLRPVHKIRFFIASQKLVEIDRIARPQRTRDGDPHYQSLVKDFSEYVIPLNTCFLVMDVQEYSGVTQVVLLHIPTGAALLAKKYGIRLSFMKPVTEDYCDLKEFAKIDLCEKMGDPVHGHSLSMDWQKAMEHPVGLDDQYHLNGLEPVSDMNLTVDERRIEDFWDIIRPDPSYEWKEECFICKSNQQTV